LVSEIKQNEIQPEVFNLKTSILDVLNTFADAIKDRDFHVEVDDLLMRDFNTDRNLFETVIKNIVDNSLIYGRKSGGQIVITLDENGHELVVKIWDNGKGIKAELINKVFDMFYKASDISKGNGLGLYIAKNSVQMLNGEIFISSKEHEYTLVEVHIPEIKTT
jgi:signal transduction histidine kinase